VNNPFNLTNKALAGINYNYHAALRRSLIVIEDNVLIYHELLVGTGSYTQLQLIPRELQKHPLCGFPFQPNWQTLECVPDISPPAPAVLLARHVHVREEDVFRVPRLRTFEPHKGKIE
jgi:hypothetical protein